SAERRSRPFTMCAAERAVVFFFSSRRRHTRSYGDWSSDVCSSDLDAFGTGLALYALAEGGVPSSHPAIERAWKFLIETQTDAGRSEERRVGKECRSRRARRSA